MIHRNHVDIFCWFDSSLALPLITRELVSVLQAGKTANETMDLSNYGFLYGTFPTAPGVFVYATQFNVDTDLVIVIRTAKLVENNRFQWKCLENRTPDRKRHGGLHFPVGSSDVRLGQDGHADQFEPVELHRRTRLVPVQHQHLGTGRHLLGHIHLPVEPKVGQDSSFLHTMSGDFSGKQPPPHPSIHPSI